MKYNIEINLPVGKLCGGCRFSYVVMTEENIQQINHIREVARTAKKGEWIKALQDLYVQGEKRFTKGDILQVYDDLIDDYCWKDKGVAYNENGSVIPNTHYVVLENYLPTLADTISTVKEVKREAKAGEWIKIVNSQFQSPISIYKDEDIMFVTQSNVGSLYAINVSTCRKGCLVFHNNYVVLENYTPPIKL